MPELPEVETVARGLQKSVAGRRIVSVRLAKTDFIDDPAALEQHLPGRQIERVERYGKFMLLRLSGRGNSAVGSENGDAEAASLLVHLGMTGQLAPYAAAEPCLKHTHVWFELDDGRELRYTDPRRFGRMAYLTGALLAEELTAFGADPLLISAEEFAASLQSRNAQIKALLLDQSVLRGVGNIYADESLWRAKIHPMRRGAELSKKQAQVLRRVLQDVLRKAILARGSSISDFLDAEGEPGEYQRHHRVYGREGKRCYRCGTAVRRVIVAGRSSHYCPKCQPAPSLRKRSVNTKTKRRSGLGAS
jgi:formamidopyrimidine-DNA glycosylase